MPHTERDDTETDIVDAVVASLRTSVATARAEGVRDVIVDAGFGFGKTPHENLRLIARTDRLRQLASADPGSSPGQALRFEAPILVGVSRKSTVGIALASMEAPAPVDERMFGSLGLAALAVIRGASIVRTHDVRPTVELLRVVLAAERAGTSA